jgi:Protein of unknown function (DUF4038)/Domain of unknown function (DUF5060)
VKPRNERSETGAAGSCDGLLCILAFASWARQNHPSILFTNEARDGTQADGVSIMVIQDNAARLVIAAVISALTAQVSAAEVPRVHCWEPHEITLKASGRYNTIYRDVSCWVRLRGPAFDKKVWGFWDGEDEQDATFRVRVLASAPGEWSWTSGSNRADDRGLNGVTGRFVAVPWTEAEKRQNVVRRGMVVASDNGHALKHADGTPCLILGDTWWSAATYRFPWYDDDTPRPLGPQAGFKDYVRYRKEQGYNCVGMIAAFPHWADDGKPWEIWLDRSKNLGLRSAWVNQTDLRGALARDRWRAKDMHNEGGRAFLLPGKVPGYENVIPDYDRINPKYFRAMDRKIDYLNRQGMIPFIEAMRRDATSAWGAYHDWPDSYARYVQYLWARYQAHVCIYSPIHFDWVGMAMSEKDLNDAANLVIERYGAPPFGTLVTCNSSLSSQVNFGRFPENRWLTLQQIGNWREHVHYWYLTEIFNTKPARPALNGEPYYSGYMDRRDFTYKYGAKGGTELDDLYVRSSIYGSFLSGGLAGHIYGAEGIWGADVEDGSDPKMWDAFRWNSANMMRHLATFALSEGTRYQSLIPDADLVVPNRTHDVNAFTGWAYCARTDTKDLFLIYYEKDCPNGVVRGALPDTTYRADWFEPRAGTWTAVAAGGSLKSDRWGRIAIPRQPSAGDWGLKLVIATAGGPGAGGRP